MPDFTLVLPDESEVTVVQDTPPTEKDYVSFLRSAGIQTPVQPDAVDYFAQQVPIGTRFNVVKGDKLEPVIAAKGDKGNRVLPFVPFEQRPGLVNRLNQAGLTPEQRRELLDEYTSTYYMGLGVEQSAARSFLENAAEGFKNTSTGQLLAGVKRNEFPLLPNAEVLQEQESKLRDIAIEKKRRKLLKTLPKGSSGYEQQANLYQGKPPSLGAGAGDISTASDKSLEQYRKQYETGADTTRTELGLYNFPALKEELRQAAYYDATESQGMAQNLAAGAGLLAGSLPAAENIVGPSAEIAAGTKLLPAIVRGGLAAAGTNMALEPALQEAQIASGDRTEGSIIDVPIAGAFGFVLGAGLTGAGRLAARYVEPLVKRLGLKKPLKEGMTPQEVRTVIEAEKPDMTPEQRAQAEAVQAELDTLPAQETGPTAQADEASQAGTMKQAKATPVQNRLNQLKNRMANEAEGEAILAQMAQQGVTVKDVADNFWNKTFPELPDKMQKYFEKYIEDEIGFKPGDDYMITAAGENVKLRDWREAYELLELPDSPTELKDTARGLVALMAEANRVLGKGMKRAEAVAPAEFLGVQETPKGPMELYNLTDDIPGSVKGSTVTRETLEKQGFEVPERPAQAEAAKVQTTLPETEPPTTQGGQANAVQIREEGLTAVQKPETKGYAQSQQNQFQAWAQEVARGNLEAGGNASPEIQSRRMEAAHVWAQGIARNNTKEVRDAQIKLLGESAENKAGKQILLARIDAAGLPIRTPRDIRKTIGAEVDAARMRASQERGRTGQPTGKSSDIKPRGTQQASLDAEIPRGKGAPPKELYLEAFDLVEEISRLRALQDNQGAARSARALSELLEEAIPGSRESEEMLLAIQQSILEESDLDATVRKRITKEILAEETSQIRPRVDEEIRQQGAPEKEVTPQEILNTDAAPKLDMPKGTNLVRVTFDDPKLKPKIYSKADIEGGLLQGIPVKKLEAGTRTSGSDAFNPVKGKIGVVRRGRSATGAPGFALNPVEVGKAIYARVKDFAEWSRQMLSRFGEAIKEQLQALWDEIRVSKPEDLKAAADRVELGENEPMGAQQPSQFMPARDMPMPGEKPRGEPLPQVPSTERKPSRFSNVTMQANDRGTPALQEGLGGTYRATTTPQVIESAQAYIAENGVQGSYNKLTSRLGDKNYQPTAVDFTIGRELVNTMMRGEVPGFGVDEAGTLVNQLSRKASTQGQAIWALSLWNDMTPEGAAKLMARVAETRGRKITETFTPADLAELNRLHDLYAKTNDPEVKLVLAARRFELLNSKLPEAVLSKWRAGLNIAMLLNPKTWVRNLGGNVLMYGAERMADSIAAPFDAWISLMTGKRAVTASLRQLAESARGLAQPYFDFQKGMALGELSGKKFWGQFREGVAMMRDLGRLTSRGKFDIGELDDAYKHIFSSKLNRMFEDTLSLGMSVNDRQFWSAAYRKSMQEQLELAARNGEQLVGPTPEILEQAIVDANRAIYQDDNFVSKALLKLREGLNYASTGGRTTQIGLGQAVAPFTKVTGSLILRGAEYSPINWLRTSYELLWPVLRMKEFDQRAFSQAFARSLVGSAAAGLGYWMLKKGIVTSAPLEDRDMEAARKAQGMGGNQINVSMLKRVLLSGDLSLDAEPLQEGDTLMTYDWAQPVSAPVAMGAAAAQAENEQRTKGLKGKAPMIDPSIMEAAAWGGIKTLQELPVFSGISSFVENLSNYGALEGTGRTLADLPSQVVPTIFGQMEQLRNNTPYETREGVGGTGMERAANIVQGGLQRAAVRAPGAGEALDLPAKRDIFGNEVERYQAATNSLFNVLLNPAFVTKAKTDPRLQEMFRLFETTGQSTQFPRAVSSTVQINGRQQALDAQQIADYQEFVGKLTGTWMDAAIADAAYLESDDAGRVQMVSQFLADANTAARVMLFGHRPANYSQDTRSLMEYVVSERPELLAIAQRQPFNTATDEEISAAYGEILRTKTDEQTEDWIKAQGPVDGVLSAIRPPSPLQSAEIVSP